MSNILSRRFFTTARVFLASVPLLSYSPILLAQDPDIQQRVAEVKESSALNKQALSHYTWQEQQTVSVKGEVKKQQVYQVRMGPDGKAIKIPLDAQPQSEPSGGRLKRHMVEKKKQEYKDYGEQIGDLSRQYAQPDPQRLQQAYQEGNVSINPLGNTGEVRLIIHNYVKPNDSVTLTFNQQQKAVQGMEISSYLDQPGDPVNIAVQFSKLPDGTNHVSGTTINGESKHLTVQTQNSNYQKL